MLRGSTNRLGRLGGACPMRDNRLGFSDLGGCFVVLDEAPRTWLQRAPPRTSALTLSSPNHNNELRSHTPRLRRYPQYDHCPRWGTLRPGALVVDRIAISVPHHEPCSLVRIFEPPHVDHRSMTPTRRRERGSVSLFGAAKLAQ